MAADGGPRRHHGDGRLLGPAQAPCALGRPLGDNTPGWGERGGMSKREWLTELVSRAAELRHASESRPYWPQRQGRGLSHDGSTPRDTRRDFARIMSDFADNGYLAEAFGEECVDNDLPDASQVIDRRLGIPDPWPLAPEPWDEDTFFGLIEVFHGLVSRPPHAPLSQLEHVRVAPLGVPQRARPHPGRGKINSCCARPASSTSWLPQARTSGAWSPSPTTPAACWCTAHRPAR